MRSISVLFLFFIFANCSAQRNIVDKSYNYNYANESTIYNNVVFFKSDSTAIIYGGKGGYKYSSHPNYEILNDSTYFIYYPNFKRTKPTKEELKDTITLKVQMEDVFNDTIYWKSDKEFIFRERLFELYEYKGIPLEDQ